MASHHSVDTPEGGEAIVRMATDSFGRLDVVVSNAGIFETVAFDELTPASWRRMLGVHLDGGFYLSQPAFRVMKAQGYGRFVFTSSSAGMFGQPLEAHYAAAKTGLVGLTNVIAIEGEPFGILANGILPFGFSRMIQGDGLGSRVPEDVAIPEFDQARARRAARRVSREPGMQLHASQLFGLLRSLRSRVRRVRRGLARGARQPADGEDFAEHIEQVSALTPFTVPTSIFDEVIGICDRLGITP